MLRSNLGHTALVICTMALMSSALAVADDARNRMATIGPGVFRSVIPEEEGDGVIDVPRFLLDRRPVTNREFLEFAQANPEWRRDNAIRLFVEGGFDLSDYPAVGAWLARVAAQPGYVPAAEA